VRIVSYLFPVIKASSDRRGAADLSVPMGIVLVAFDCHAIREFESDSVRAGRVPGAACNALDELFAAAIVAAVIPLIILLPLQRFYVQWVTAAAPKD
jgi:hypothetical protein